MAYEDFAKSLESSKPLSAYQISGEDMFWTRLAYEKLLSYADPLDIVKLESPQSIQEGLFALGAVPMLSEYKIVVFEGYQKFGAEDKKKLTEYINNPIEGSILILYNCEQINSKKLEKLVFSNLNEFALVPIIINYAKQQGGIIEQDAARTLASYAENDMGIIDNELKKLIAYADNAPITLEMVKECVVPSITYQVYHFAEAVASGDYEKSYKILYSLAKSQSEYSRYLSNITSYFRNVFYTKVSSLSDLELASLLSTRDFAIKKARRIAKSYMAVELFGLLKLFYRLEYEFKSGKIGVDSALELAIAEAIERRIK